MSLDPETGYDLYAKDYRGDHRHLDSFEGETAGLWSSEVYEAAQKLFPLVRILDAGCGDGRTLGRWAKKLDLLESEIWGVDLSREMLNQAQKRVPGARLEKLDLQDLSAVSAWSESKGKFEVLTSFFVLVHFRRPSDFFAAVWELLAPRGQFLMNTIPQRRPPELQAGGKKFTIQAFHHESDDVVEAGNRVGLRLERRKDFWEKELVSTLLWWTKP